VRSYLNGEGGYKTIAHKHDISHALLMIWVEKYRAGDLTEEIEDAETIRECEAKVAALERKVGRLVMELDLLKKEPRRRRPTRRSRSSSGRRVFRAGRMRNDEPSNQQLL
jgi:transposase-like protein